MISRQLLLQLPDFYLYNCKSRVGQGVPKALCLAVPASSRHLWGVCSESAQERYPAQGKPQRGIKKQSSGTVFESEPKEHSPDPLQERAFPKRDVEDAIPYIFQRADNIRPYKHKSDLLHMILFSAKGNI